MTRRPTPSAMLFCAALTAGCGPLATLTASAENIPESLRIEQKALKEYTQKPVVPIDRGNAHHRDLEGVSGDKTPPTPSTISPAQPRSGHGAER